MEARARESRQSCSADGALIQMRDVFALPHLLLSPLSSLFSSSKRNRISVSCRTGEGRRAAIPVPPPGRILSFYYSLIIGSNVTQTLISPAAEDVWLVWFFPLRPYTKRLAFRGRVLSPAAQPASGFFKLHLEAPDRQSVAAARYAEVGVKFYEYYLSRWWRVLL